MLETNGYTLENGEYDDGIKSECIGYFMDEHTEYRPYFNGIILNVSKNSLVKKR